MLSLEDFIVTVFCFVDDHFKELTQGQRLRSRGFSPALADSEVIAMEIVGEFLGIDTDKGIWEYFRRHWLHFFPQLGSRTSFARQAANLWSCKMKLQNRVAQQLGAFADTLHLVDGIPMPVCRFARAHFSRVFRGQATFGYCASKKETYYGFHGHLLVSKAGIITAFTLTPANTDERQALWDLSGTIHGLLVGDKGYISAPLGEELRREGIDLQTPLRSNMRDNRDPAWVKKLTPIRRIIETVIGQLAERFHIEKVRARDLWHQTSRLARKLLGHTMAVFLNVLRGREPLQFEGLIKG
jgi:IS5 family transposase